MDFQSVAWLSDLEMEEVDLMNQHQMRNPFSDHVFSSESFTDNPSLPTKNQAFQAANSYINRDIAKQPCDHNPNTFTISFGNTYNSASDNIINPHPLYGVSDLKNTNMLKRKEEMNVNDFDGIMEVDQKAVAGTSKNPIQAQEHVLAERKRREKLTQRFIALSALIPDLKKMDKASVLEDATKYIKQLEIRVKELEKTSSMAEAEKFNQEAAVSIRRSNEFCGDGDGDDDSSSSDEMNSSPSNGTYYREIEVRISGSSVLVRLYSQRKSSLAMKALSEMERLHLTIVSSSVIPFSNTALLITITAQMGDEFVMTAKDLVKKLQMALNEYL